LFTGALVVPVEVTLIVGDTEPKFDHAAVEAGELNVPVEATKAFDMVPAVIATFPPRLIELTALELIGGRFTAVRTTFAAPIKVPSTVFVSVCRAREATPPIVDLPTGTVSLRSGTPIVVVPLPPKREPQRASRTGQTVLAEAMI
jgi:hypothetical protein